MGRRAFRKFFVSIEFKEAVISASQNLPLYMLAAKANFAPATLSRAINKKERFKVDDSRLIKVAEIIGFEGDIFDQDSSTKVLV